VKLGLAEKINFEVTLLKAVEASRARAIDSLIKELSALADESPAEAGDGSEKKKGGLTGWKSDWGLTARLVR
jgi:DNA polymerase-3 subunit gamma/tau